MGSQYYCACRGQCLRNSYEVLLYLLQCKLSLFTSSLSKQDRGSKYYKDFQTAEDSGNFNLLNEVDVIMN